MADTSVEKPLDEPRTLFVKDGVYYMDTEVEGLRIPKIRHAGGPDWETELGPIKELVENLHNKSQRHGWILRYWSHEAMDATMNACEILALRDAYFTIKQEYRAARCDLFRLYVLFLQGGLWLDLRCIPANDPGDIGLETIPNTYGKALPTLLLSYAGHHRAMFENKHGEIINGFLMSVPSHEIWPKVWQLVIQMILSYPSRWRESAATHLKGKDVSKKYYPINCDLVGREGVLCLGPLAMSQVVYPYLEQNNATSKCMPKSFRGFWPLNALKHYATKQGQLFFKIQRKLVRISTTANLPHLLWILVFRSLQLMMNPILMIHSTIKTVLQSLFRWLMQCRTF